MPGRALLIQALQQVQIIPLLVGAKIVNRSQMPWLKYWFCTYQPVKRPDWTCQGTAETTVNWEKSILEESPIWSSTPVHF
jgi:hypothetical protein